MTSFLSPRLFRYYLIPLAAGLFLLLAGGCNCGPKPLPPSNRHKKPPQKTYPQNKHLQRTEASMRSSPTSLLQTKSNPTCLLLPNARADVTAPKGTIVSMGNARPIHEETPFIVAATQVASQEPPAKMPMATTPNAQKLQSAIVPKSVGNPLVARSVTTAKTKIPSVRTEAVSYNPPPYATPPATKPKAVASLG